MHFTCCRCLFLFFFSYFVETLAFRLECIELQICTKPETPFNGKHFSHFIIPPGKEKSIFINENATTLKQLTGERWQCTSTWGVGWSRRNTYVYFLHEDVRRPMARANAESKSAKGQSCQRLSAVRTTIIFPFSVRFYIHTYTRLYVWCMHIVFGSNNVDTSVQNKME